ncbi:MAG: preprotein translocase subunit YajC [Kiritimatiellae bacterium]|nr:preprotein translocase subunit YajC [Kiritimatiellia bacterium]
MNETTTIEAAPAAVEIQPAEQTGATGAERPQQQGGFGMFVPMLLILAIFYFMMIRPQQRKEKERRKMIEELRAGAKIVFGNGILGTIIEATEKTFKVETAPGVSMEVLRSAVQGVADEK